MTLPLQAVSDPATDENFRQIAQQFPIGKANLAMGAWTAVTFQNTWENLEASTPVKYRKSAEGRVTIRGIAKKAAAAKETVIFTLPEGFRPPQRQFFVGDRGGTVEFVTVESNGAVKYTGIIEAIAFLTLDTISFYTD